MLNNLFALGRRIQTKWIVFKSKHICQVGIDLHIGARSRFWAPNSISLGNSVYIGKDVLIECNAEIGDYVLIANNVALVGKHDHDFRAQGIPIRFSPWIGCSSRTSPYLNEKVIIASDVWLGYGAIVLSGVKIGQGAIVAAGAVVTRDVKAYEIVAGNPAQKVGYRFIDKSMIALHEESIRTGFFRFSELGYDHWIVKPGHESFNNNYTK